MQLRKFIERFGLPEYVVAFMRHYLHGNTNIINILEFLDTNDCEIHPNVNVQGNVTINRSKLSHIVKLKHAIQFKINLNRLELNVCSIMLQL